MSKISELDEARDVFAAVKLAELGATPQLVQKMTRFGARWARRIVRENGGSQCTYRRLEDPASWFDRKPERMLHGWFVVKAYRWHQARPHPGERLLRTIGTYRQFAPRPLLDVNMANAIIELYQGGMACERVCIQCRQTHLVVSEHAYCALCRRVESMLCKGCGGVLPEQSQRERRGRPRLYCSACECSHAHRVLLRTNGAHTLVRAVV